MSPACDNHPCSIADIEGFIEDVLVLLIQAVTEKPIPGGQSGADSIAAMDSSSHSTSAVPLHAVPAAKERDRGAAATSSPSAWYAAPQQPRDIRAILRCVHPLMTLSRRSTCISHDFLGLAFYDGLMSAGVSASQRHFNSSLHWLACRSHCDDTFGSQQRAQDPINHILQNLQHMWNRLTCINSAGVR